MLNGNLKLTASTMRVTLALVLISIFSFSCSPTPKIEPSLFDSDSRPAKGSPTASISISEFIDYTCKHCRRQAQILDEFLREEPHDVKLTVRYLPHDDVGGLAARAALAAHQQGRFWEMHQELFAAHNDLDQELIVALAAALGLDLKSFQDAMDSPTIAKMIREDGALASRSKIWGVPWLVVNRESMSGVVTLPELRKIVRELKSGQHKPPIFR